MVSSLLIQTRCFIRIGHRFARGTVLSFWSILMISAVLGALSLAGCGAPVEANLTPPTPPEIGVVPVIRKTVPEYYDYVGYIESMLNVDIRARVKGFLEKRLFVEGDDVKAGNLLYTIERRQYEAALEGARAALRRSHAAAADARLEKERYLMLLQRESTSKSEYDTKLAASEMADAQVQLDEAAVRRAQITLSYCSVVSPIDGRIGRTKIHVGNLVGVDGNTMLTTIVKLDPIYITFAPASEHLSKIFPLLSDSNPLEVAIRAADQGGWSAQRGTVNFLNNQIQKSTSTILLRATMPNTDKKLLPGQYVEVRLFLKEIADAMLVPTIVIQRKQTGTQILVADPKGVLHARKVELGAEYGNLTRIIEGLKPDDLIVTEKWLLLRPGSTIRPKQTQPAKPKEEAKILPTEATS